MSHTILATRRIFRFYIVLVALATLLSGAQAASAFTLIDLGRPILTIGPDPKFTLSQIVGTTNTSSTFTLTGCDSDGDGDTDEFDQCTTALVAHVPPGGVPDQHPGDPLFAFLRMSGPLASKFGGQYDQEIDVGTLRVLARLASDSLDPGPEIFTVNYRTSHSLIIKEGATTGELVASTELGDTVDFLFADPAVNALYSNAQIRSIVIRFEDISPPPTGDVLSDFTARVTSITLYASTVPEPASLAVWSVLGATGAVAAVRRKSARRKSVSA